ncbi:HEC/Ndc80p family protein-like protein [Aureobasidium pullulans]|nr:HEC/Ndc80p family protein-like protein [Aureobasidium pullulans]
MASKFEASNQQNLEQVKALEEESKQLQEQIDELGKTAPRLAKLDEQNKILEEDRVKFENYNNSIDKKVEKYEDRLRMLESEMQRLDQELADAEQERNSLQEMVDRQGITVSDIDRMTAERKRLQTGVESTNLRLEETRDAVAKKEAEAAQRLEELESVVSKYNRMAYEIGVIPPDAPNAHGQEYELILSTSEGPAFGSSQMGEQPQDADRLLAETGTGYQPHHLLNLDVRGSLKSNMINLRKEISERRNNALEADMNNHDLLDKIKEAIEDKRAEAETLEHRIRAAEDEFEKTKEITNSQKMASDAQIEKMEKELARMRAGLTESVQLMEQREMNTNLEYEQLTVASSALREELHTELERMLNDIIKFKVHIQGSLEGYEEFVAQEVERECEEQEREEMGADDEKYGEDVEAKVEEMDLDE